MKNCPGIIVLLLTFLISYGYAQDFKVKFIDSNKKIKCKKFFSSVNDSVGIHRSVDNCLIDFYSKGFIEARVDSINLFNNSVSVYGFMGKKYRWGRIETDNSSSRIINEQGLELMKFDGKPINPNQLNRFIKSVLNDLQNNGYPFAIVKFKNVAINESKVSASLIIEKGRSVVVDTVYNKGDLAIKHKVLLSIIGIKKGGLYNEKLIQQVDKKFRQHPFIGLIKSTEVEFIPGKARLYTYLKRQNASQFTGLAGFYTDESTGSIKFTGDIHLKLVNQFHNAEIIEFSWLSPESGTQRLNISTEWPSILGQQIGFGGLFSLYKRDSSFLNLNPRFSIDIRAFSGNLIKVFADYRVSKVSANVQQQNISNYSTLLYGLGLQLFTLDNQLIPSSGLRFYMSLSMGNKLVSEKKQEESLYEGYTNLAFYQPFFNKRLVLALLSKSKLLYQSSGNKFMENELYRIGGIETLRGFNQESILTSFFSVNTLEMHLRFNQSSSIFAFTEKGYVKTYQATNFFNNWPYSLGLGLTLSTKAGSLNLVYAMGKGFGQNLGLKDAKVHIGYSAVF